MINNDLKSDTIEYGKKEQGLFIQNANASLSSLKNNKSIYFTTLAYKGLSSQARNSIGAIERGFSRRYGRRHYELAIERYENIIVNLSLIQKIPEIGDLSSLSKAAEDLKKIYWTDELYRGYIPDRRLQVSLHEAELGIRRWNNGAEITEDVIKGVNGEPKKEISLLESLKVFLKSLGLGHEEVDELIVRWSEESLPLLPKFLELVWILYYNTVKGKAHGSRKADKPKGTYVLFNINMDKNSPKEVFGKMLNWDRDKEDENIYHQFKRKFYDNVASAEWNEKKKFLIIDGAGYISPDEKEVKIKFRDGKRREYVYPKRIFDKEVFAEQYKKWKRYWMGKLKLDDAGWSGYIAGLNPYFRRHQL